MISAWWIGAVALAVSGHWLVPAPRRRSYNAVVGIVMMAVASWVGALALAATTLVTFIATRSGRPGRTVVGLVALAAGFAVYKLGADPLSEASTTSRATAALGFAFTAPRAAHVMIDVRSGRLPAPPFAGLASYLWYWPLLVIGPIHRYQDHDREFRRHRPDAALFAQGIERVVFGLFAVVVVATRLVTHGLGAWIDGLDTDREGLVAAARSVEYGLALYAAFAGWSAVAIGVANLQGIRVAPNFRRPFFQSNIAEFWRGWHISLTRWATDYLYRPAMAQTRQHLVAIAITMVAIGVWHEFSPLYVIWGAYHAAGLALHRRFQRWRGDRRVSLTWLARGVSTATTVVFVMLGFTITRATSVANMFDEFNAIFTGGW